MTDRLRSCKDSPDGRHSAAVDSFICRYCHRSMSYLMDHGLPTPQNPKSYVGTPSQFEQDVACVRRHYGDKVADAWAKSRVSTVTTEPTYETSDASWRRPSDTAAEQLARRGRWNTIEGDPE